MNLLLGHAFEQICHSAHLAIFLGADDGWLSSVSFLDVSQTLAGSAVLCKCYVRCGVKHHRTYIQTKRKKCFCEKQCETSLLRQTSSFAQDMCSASWMKQSARATSTVGFPAISPTVQVLVSPATKQDPLAPHRNSALTFFMGSLQVATCPCSAFGSASHAHSFNLVGNSLRLLAVVSGELEANMWRRILLWLCHQHLGDKFAARDGEPSATGVAISAACNVSTVISLPESAFSGLLSLRVHESTRCGYRSTQVPRNWFRAFF